MRNDFVVKNKSNPNELLGSITDGNYKVDVLLNKNDNDLSNFEKGAKLEIIGDLQEQGNCFFLSYM